MTQVEKGMWKVDTEEAGEQGGYQQIYDTPGVKTPDTIPSKPELKRRKSLEVLPDDSGKSGAKKGASVLPVALLFPRLIGGAVACFIYTCGDTEFYDTQIDILATYRLGWLYLGVGAFSVMVAFLNFYPAMVHKVSACTLIQALLWLEQSDISIDEGTKHIDAFICGFAAQTAFVSSTPANVRANSLIFKVDGGTGSEPWVIMEEEGVIGKYNRANRSLHHFNEGAAGEPPVANHP